MRSWLRDRPWIWIVLLLLLVVLACIATIIIAQANKPEIIGLLTGLPGLEIGMIPLQTPNPVFA